MSRPVRRSKSPAEWRYRVALKVERRIHDELGDLYRRCMHSDLSLAEIEELISAKERMLAWAGRMVLKRMTEWKANA